MGRMIVFVCGAIALGTLVGACIAPERDARIFFLLCFLFNAAAIVAGLIEASPYLLAWFPIG